MKRSRFRSPPENKRKARLIQHNGYYVELKINGLD
nr:MAG TPA: protein of unknown function (DUF3511) [Caudoviricetes sp.]